jgi:tyramine---L-glutamate ligase
VKIAVLEWICGGGMSNVPAHEIPGSLRQEGAAMLHALLQAFRDSNCHVTTAIDERALGVRAWQADEILPVRTSVELIENIVPAEWVRLAADSDFSIVIAPEFSGVLETSLSVLRDANSSLLNCSGAFLCNTCDKLKTARNLLASDIAHPATLRLDEVKSSDFDSLFTQEFVVKPRDGAGSDRIEICSLESLAERRLAVGAEHFIVQPKLDGNAFSCSAVVDRTGACHWLPLVCQDLDQHLKYHGGRIANEAMQMKRPLEMLARSVAAMGARAWGWIGVDLLYDCKTEAWVVIEINPRFTTSVIGLSTILKHGLGALLRDAFLGQCNSVEVQVQDMRFTAGGEVYSGASGTWGR